MFDAIRHRQILHCFQLKCYIAVHIGVQCESRIEYTEYLTDFLTSTNASAQMTSTVYLTRKKYELRNVLSLITKFVSLAEIANNLCGSYTRNVITCILILSFQTGHGALYRLEFCVMCDFMFFIRFPIALTVHCKSFQSNTINAKF